MTIDEHRNYLLRDSHDGEDVLDISQPPRFLPELQDVHHEAKEADLVIILTS